jgi:hypothetical protein
MDEETIRERARIYLVAYDEAMKITHNSSIAMQVGMCVLTAGNVTNNAFAKLEKENQTTNFIEQFLATAFQAQKEYDESEEDYEGELTKS